MLGDIRALGKETLVYGLSTVVARLLNFLLLPFYTHFLLPGEYGVVALVFSYIAFLNIAFQYGMDQAYLRHAAGQKRSRVETVFTTAAVFLLLTTILLGAAMTVSAGALAPALGLRPEHAPLIRCAALILALDALSIVPFAELRLAHRKWLFVGVKFFNIVVNVGMNVFLLGVLGLGVKGVFLASMTATGTSLMLLAPVFAQFLRRRFDPKLLKELLRFGLPLVPAGIGAMMVQVIDRPILQMLTDEATVGVYQANYRLGIFMLLVVSMFDQAWRPFFLERAKRKDAKALFARVLTYFLAVSIWIVLFFSLFIVDIVQIPIGKAQLIHPSYYGGLGVVPIVLAAYLFHGAYINFMVSVTLSKRTDLLIWVTFLGAIVNVITNVVLIPEMGMMGAAWATFAAYAAMAAALYVLGRRVYPITYEWSRIARVAGAALLTAWLAVEIQPSLAGGAWFAARAGLLLLLPVLVALTGFLTKNERTSLRRFLKLS